MLWVCRTGANSIYYEYFVSNSKIYLAWEGYKEDLSSYKDLYSYRKLVTEEKGPCATTSISNWAGQLYAFCHEMAIGDYVLIPSRGSKEYVLAIIDGEYEYDSCNDKQLYHSRKVRIIKKGIPRKIFSQSLQYSLCAYRTIFRIKKSDELLAAIRSYNSIPKSVDRG